MTAQASLVMLGPAPGTRSAIATIVDAYRHQGLFRRWPIRYVATHGGTGIAQRAIAPARAAARLTTLLARPGGAVLHVHACGGASFWREATFMAAALAARCPVLAHLHGDFAGFYDRSAPPAQSAIRATLERAACVGASSQRVVASLRTIAPAARIAWLPAPIALAPPSASPRANLVVYLGRLKAEKGVFELLQALALVREAVPDVRLVFAGEGDRAPLRRAAERLGIADAVKFVGWVGPSGKRVLLETAAAFALPSYAEALPVSLLEAMAAGVPVVASAVGAIPEVVVDGVTGFLAPAGDIATLQRLLRRLLLDRALGEKVGHAARESVRLRFSPERALPALETLYADLGVEALAQPARAPVEPDLGKAA